MIKLVNRQSLAILFEKDMYCTCSKKKYWSHKNTILPIACFSNNKYLVFTRYATLPHYLDDIIITYRQIMYLLKISIIICSLFTYYFH